LGIWATSLLLIWEFGTLLRGLIWGFGQLRCLDLGIWATVLLGFGNLGR